jgi:small subunit ribosomal protein S8
MDNGVLQYDIELKYSDSQPVIRTIERVSRPGRRVYASVKNIPSVANGLGVSILSTPKGVMADHEAKAQNLGGEVLCRVF